MYFESLETRLLAHIRAKVVSGEVTERGLARLTGISQPHLHNVLKGVRSLSIEMADQIMRRLRITVLDLMEEKDLAALAPPRASATSRYREVPFLEGEIGPGRPFPAQASLYQRYPFAASDLATLVHPVTARLADDPVMRNLFRANDLVLLDEAEMHRLRPVPTGYYVIDGRGTSMIRHVIRESGVLLLFTDNEPGGDRAFISLADRNILDVVKARVVWIGHYLEPLPSAT
jgi:transcriptional regulator with XRE-family HTH domain